MADFKIDGRMKVGKLKELFKNEFQGTLRVYKGSRLADDDATLASIRCNEDAKNGEFTCRASRTVGKFCEELLHDFGIKVKVATFDDWVIVLDGITLSTLKELPKNATIEILKKYVAYKRDNEKSETDSDNEMQIISEENESAQDIDLEVYYTENVFEFENANGETESYALINEIETIFINGNPLTSEEVQEIIERSEDLDEYIDTDDDAIYNMAYQKSEIMDEILTITKYENKSSSNFKLKGNVFNLKKLFFPHYEINYFDEEIDYEFDEWGNSNSVIYDNELIEGDLGDSKGLSSEVIWER